MSDDCKCPDRRNFLKLGGMTLVISAVNPRLVRALGDPRLERIRTNAGSGKTFIYIFQRFGADGLNTVIPTEAGEYATYQSYRNKAPLAIPMANLTPQQLTPDFALHPACQAGLYQLWQQGKLAVLHSVGYDNASRSHFDSQSFIDHGTPFDKTTADGWLNRWLQTAPANPDPLRALAFSTTMPVTLAGPAPALSFSDISQLAISGNATRDALFRQIQGTVYALPHSGRPYDQELATVGTGLIDAINSIPAASSLPVPGPGYPNTTFGRQLSQLGQLINSNLFSIELAEIDIGGWDHHATQGALTGSFPTLLQQMSDGIYALQNDLGSKMQDTIICTVSEFGRTARENGNQGTDHGSAWATFVTGGAVNPGVYGTWKGLSNLRENRDLDHSIDFRDLFSEILSKHMGSLDPSVFPGWSYTPLGML